MHHAGESGEALGINVETVAYSIIVEEAEKALQLIKDEGHGSHGLPLLENVKILLGNLAGSNAKRDDLANEVESLNNRNQSVMRVLVDVRLCGEREELLQAVQRVVACVRQQQTRLEAAEEQLRDHGIWK